MDPGLETFELYKHVFMWQVVVATFKRPLKRVIITERLLRTVALIFISVKSVRYLVGFSS